MGVYLLAIAIVDLIYNTIFYQIVSEWTNSMTCIIIALVNFVSSETSLLILSILSFFRMLSISKIGGMLVFKSEVKVTCACAWIAIVITGVAYAAYLFTHNMEVRNNMCILTGVSHQRYITSLEYIFQIAFIGVSLIFLIVIIVSMACIFHTVIKSSKLVAKSSGHHAKSHSLRLFHTGLRLLILLVCNVFTWLPFLTVSIMLLCGVSVHESVLQWVVVLSIPICACTDPVLYNLVSLKVHLKKMFMKKNSGKGVTSQVPLKRVPRFTTTE